MRAALTAGLLALSCAVASPLTSVAASPGTSVVSSPRTRLQITLYPRGREHSQVIHYRLTCDSSGGTVPHAAHACHMLARLAHAFAPVPRGTMCSDVMLGPQEAVVKGVLDGRQLDVRGSCEIGRWRALRAVVPGFDGQ